MDNDGSSTPNRYPNRHPYPLWNHPRSGLDPYLRPPLCTYPFSNPSHRHPPHPPRSPTSSSPPSGSVEHIRPAPVGYYSPPPYPYPYPHYQPAHNVTPPQTSIRPPCNFQGSRSFRYFPTVEALPPAEEKIKSHSRASSYAGPFESQSAGGAWSLQTKDSSSTSGMSVCPLSLDGIVINARFPNNGHSSPTKSSVQPMFRHSNSVSILNHEGEFSGLCWNSSFSGLGSARFNELDPHSSRFQDHPGSLHENVQTQNLDVVPVSTKGPLKTLLPVLNSYGRLYKQGTTLTLSIQYVPIERLNHHYQGIDSEPDCTGVPGTYFPLRKGGSVTLYQDAHVPDGLLPLVMLDGGKYHV